MILKSFSNHLKEQNWLAVMLDLLTVIMGIFLGLQANNWNEDRVTSNTAQKYYKRLAEDLRAEDKARVSRVLYQKRTKKHAETALQTINESDGSAGSQFLIDLYQASQIWPYTPVSATYDELLSGNILNAIPNDNLRKKLANYYVALENSKLIMREIPPYRENIRMYLPHYVQGKIRKNCGDIFSFDQNENTFLTLPDKCDLTFSAQDLANALEDIGGYNNLKLELTRQLSDIDTKIIQLEAYVSLTKVLLKDIEILIQ